MQSKKSSMVEEGCVEAMREFSAEFGRKDEVLIPNAKLNSDSNPALILCLTLTLF